MAPVTIYDWILIGASKPDLLIETVKGFVLNYLFTYSMLKQSSLFL